MFELNRKIEEEEEPKTHFAKLENGQIVSYWCCTEQETIDNSGNKEIVNRYAYANKKYLGMGKIYSIFGYIQNQNVPNNHHFWD